MATTFKVLGQLNPAATTLSTLYTVPGSTQAVVSSIVACNQSTTDTTIRISVAVAGAADNAKQYIAYDLLLRALDTLSLTLGVTLGAGDLIRVYSAMSTTSFNVYGEEIA